MGDAPRVAFCYRRFDPWSTVRAWLTMVGVGPPLSLILEVISRHSRGMEQIMFGGLRISSLLFADDVILFSSLSPAFTGAKSCCWWLVEPCFHLWPWAVGSYQKNITTDTNRRRSQSRHPSKPSQFAWKCLGVFSKDLEEVDEKTEVWASTLILLPPQPECLHCTRPNCKLKQLCI